MMTGRRRERGATMVEFVLVAGLFFLLITTLLDVGKGVYVKNTLDAAARDGARVGVVLRGPNNSGAQPTLSDIETAIKQHSSDVAFATPCPFGTPSATGLASNKGAVFIDQMPGGGPGTVSLSGCNTIPPAVSGNVKIKVTIMYKYTPITPLVGQFTGSLTFTSTSTMTTEY
jgi:Flp pilus assembly protein TadG